MGKTGYATQLLREKINRPTSICEIVSKREGRLGHGCLVHENQQKFFIVTTCKVIQRRDEDERGDEDIEVKFRKGSKVFNLVDVRTDEPFCFDDASGLVLIFVDKHSSKFQHGTDGKKTCSILTKSPSITEHDENKECFCYVGGNCYTIECNSNGKCKVLVNNNPSSGSADGLDGIHNGLVILQKINTSSTSADNNMGVVGIANSCGDGQMVISPVWLKSKINGIMAKRGVQISSAPGPSSNNQNLPSATSAVLPQDQVNTETSASVVLASGETPPQANQPTTATSNPQRDSKNLDRATSVSSIKDSKDDVSERVDTSATLRPSDGNQDVSDGPPVVQPPSAQNSEESVFQATQPPAPADNNSQNPMGTISTSSSTAGNSPREEDNGSLQSLTCLPVKSREIPPDETLQGQQTVCDYENFLALSTGSPQVLSDGGCDLPNSQSTRREVPPTLPSNPTQLGHRPLQGNHQAEDRKPVNSSFDKNQRAVKDLPYAVYGKICLKLNIRSAFFNDFRMVAEELGLDRDRTDLAGQDKNPTDFIFTQYYRNVKVCRLIEILHRIERMDVAKVLENWVANT